MSGKDAKRHGVPEARVQAQRTLWAAWRGKSTGARTPEGLQSISEANLKHGLYAKDKLEAQRKRGEVGRRVLAEIKQIEVELLAVGLIDK